MRIFYIILLALFLSRAPAYGQETVPATSGPAVSGPPLVPKAQTPLTRFKVTNRFPHDVEAFTQGLLFHNGVFYEGTGHYGKSKIRRVEVATGRVLQEWAFPDSLFGEGLTLFNDFLFGLSWRSGVGFVLKRDTLKPAGYFQYEGAGWGLTDDEKFLYMSNGSDRLYVRDPSNFQVIKTIDVKDQGRPIINLNELEWINGEIWANIWKERRIARIDPATGRVKSWLDLSAIVSATKGSDDVDNVLNGIAYNPKTRRVYVTGKYWPKLYELEIEDFK